MKNWFKMACMAGALALAPAAFAEEAAVVEEPVAVAAEAEAAPAAAVEMSATGEQVVKVNTGNAMVDAAANLAVKCAERSAAMRTCEALGGFKAMGCRKLAEMRYKDVICSL